MLREFFYPSNFKITVSMEPQWAAYRHWL